ncbi:hypothetical protein [Paenibacillus sp. CF384]|uniref:hypothetical protein n=1 Tax=Paenibacillus sp. CF384 TaxID=1884382 RepID=UPI00089AE1D2|nr:hypothetical protein [Paenibacillus sp. CF384]SDX54610.1 hypothetical protein SAMN05518855_101623 [Paenibacillus sp. CF384]
MKKALLASGIIGLLLTAVPTVQAQSVENKDLGGTTVLNLNPRGDNYNDVTLQEKTGLIVQDADVTSSTIELKGYLSNTNKPIDIYATLKKPDYTNEMVVGDAEDKAGNYEVVFLGIDKKPQSSLTFNHSFNASDEVLKVYLMEKDTRNFTIIETTDFKDIINENTVFQNVNSLPEADHEDVFWYSKILAPEMVNSIQPRSIVTGHSDKTYTVSYAAAGQTIYEEMVIRSYVEGPQSIINSGTFNTKLYVLSERTYCPTLPSMNSNNSDWELGYYAPTVFETHTDPGDAVRTIQWDSSTQTSTSGKFKLDWSWSLPGTPVSFGFTPGGTTSSDATSLRNFDNTSTSVCKNILSTLKQGNYFSNVGHTFDQVITVGHFTGAAATKLLSLKWTYNMSNGHDYTAGGNNSHNMSFSYVSNP